MKVLVDTSVWSLSLRRRTPVDDSVVRELIELVREGRASILAAIRQELLNGVRERAVFDRLRDKLRAFPDETLDTADYERATEHFNTCRSKGLQGSNTDFLLCAIAERGAMPILTTDADFTRYAELLPITLHAPRQ
jgi:predicted nucleic acid-binding protein